MFTDKCRSFLNKETDCSQLLDRLKLSGLLRSEIKSVGCLLCTLGNSTLEEQANTVQMYLSIPSVDDEGWCFEERIREDE